jgi:hypothetical protein
MAMQPPDVDLHGPGSGWCLCVPLGAWLWGRTTNFTNNIWPSHVWPWWSHPSSWRALHCSNIGHFIHQFLLKLHRNISTKHGHKTLWQNTKVLNECYQCCMHEKMKAMLLTPKIPSVFLTNLCNFWPSWKNPFFYQKKYENLRKWP